MQSRTLMADIAVLLALLVILSVPLFIWIKKHRDRRRRRRNRRSSVDRPYFFEEASRERITRTKNRDFAAEAALRDAALNGGHSKPGPDGDQPS